MTEDAILWGLTTGDQLWTYLGALLMVTALAYVARHWKGKPGEIIGRAISEVGDAIREVYQTYVGALKDGRADGKLTDAERATAKRMAIAIAKSNIGKKGLGRLMRVLGIDALDDWLGSKVEAAIADAKVVGKAAAGGSTPRPLPLPSASTR